MNGYVKKIIKILINKEEIREMLDNNIQNNTQNENEKVVQNGIQNVHQKFTARQNELRLYIINFTIDNKRPYNLESDKEVTLQVLQMDEQEYEEIIQCLIDKDGMVVDEEAKNVNFIYPVSSLETNHRVTLADGREFTAMCAIDAMGAAFTFHQDTEVHSVCAMCEEPVYVKIVDGKVADYAPKTLHALTFPLGELANWAGSC